MGDNPNECELLASVGKVSRKQSNLMNQVKEFSR